MMRGRIGDYLAGFLLWWDEHRTSIVWFVLPTLVVLFTHACTFCIGRATA